MQLESDFENGNVLSLKQWLEFCSFSWKMILIWFVSFWSAGEIFCNTSLIIHDSNHEQDLKMEIWGILTGGAMPCWRIAVSLNESAINLQSMNLPSMNFWKLYRVWVMHWHFWQMVCNMCFFWQAGFDQNDIQYKSMRVISKTAQCAMLPDFPIHCVDLTVGMVSPTFRFYCTVSNIGDLV